MAKGTPRHGIAGEFETADAMLGALRRLRAGGYERLDALTPYPVEGAEEALGLARSTIPRWVLAAGLLGAAAAYLVQWWTNAIDYPLVVGGRPLASVPAYVPITFETAILCASLMAFCALLRKARLPALWHPVFEVDGIESAQVDRFWVAISGDDARYTPEGTAAELRAAGARRVSLISEAGR